ncbi:Rap1a/Tai family immunity protein [Teichococcus rhizosphaerae]|nr:Rap1a/Tai family immunity protein [Pseudoroseomonas rhizosphaerae]
MAAALAAMAGAPALAQNAAPAPASPAVTQVRTVADLAAICDPAAGPLRLESIAYCQGYITAAGQYHAALFPAGGGRPPLYCVPSPAPSVAQTGLAFAAWARQNTQYAAEPALDGLHRWAQATYPCPAGNAPRTGRPASR